MISYKVTANCITQSSITRMVASYYRNIGEEFPLGEEVPLELRPDTVAPLIVYLASEAAAGISGRIFGSYGYKYIRWSEPLHECVLESKDNGPWDLDHVFEHFEETLAKGLDLKKDLPWAMDSLEQQAVFVPK